MPNIKNDIYEEPCENGTLFGHEGTCVMAKSDREVRVYTKSKVALLIARRVRIRTRLIKRVLNGLEEIMMELLSEADEDTDVSVRLFEGMTFDSRYLPPKDKVNNLTGESIVTQEKIRAKVNVTRYYNEKLLPRDDLEDGSEEDAA